MSRWIREGTLALGLGALVAGCGGRPVVPTQVTIDDLRARAQESPDDPMAQRHLAIGELLMVGGNARAARAQIDRALELAPADERLLLVSAMESELHGHPAPALAAYLDALDAATRSDDPLAPAVAEATVAAVEGLEEIAPGYYSTVTSRLEPVVARPGRIGEAARHAAGVRLMDLAYRRGDLDEARRLARTLGCLTEWRVAGPFGPRDLLGFDDTFPIESAGTLANSYDLGPGRGVRDTRDHRARGCAVHLGDGPVAAGGTTFAQAVTQIPRDGRWRVRLETPNAVELFVDGRSVIRMDRRLEPTPRTTFHTVELARGSHELTVKVTTRHPNPILVLSITGPDGLAPGESRTDEVSPPLGRPEQDDPLGTYLRSAIAHSRGDVVSAREALNPHARAPLASAAVLLARAAVALSDPLSSSETGRDDARRLLRRARRRDPDAIGPALQLARLDAADGRTLQAIGALRRARQKWPEVVSIPLTLTDLYLARGWSAQADDAVAIAQRLLPDGCRPVRGALASAERRLRAREVLALARRLTACDARSTAQFQTLVRRRQWDEAEREMTRLARLEPPQSRFGILSASVDVARGRGDHETVARLLAEMARLQPRSVTTALARIDGLLAQGLDAEAQSLISTSLAAEPAALAELRLLERHASGTFALAPFRLDGARVLQEFEASGRRYEEPQVLVLDYTVVRIFEDGSTLELTHNIYRLQSEEAVDEQGEFRPPEGATILTLHTIKADGRRIEPEHIEGKDTISLPGLAPGDFVEFEYVRTGEPPAGFPGGFLGDRFYFRSFETPFDLSQLTLVMPEGVTPRVDPRGPAPPTEERVENGLRVLRWTARESRPFVAEPQTVSAREFVPSINVGIGATWELFVDGLVDALADKDVRDPAASRLVARILGGARRADDLTRARRIYAWVLHNVENTDEVFGMAPIMLAERNGNRARILHYLLGIAGVESSLALIRDATADATRSELPDGETFDHLLVILGRGPNRMLLSTAERGAPFGYIPPLLRGQDGLVLRRGAPSITVPSGASGADRRSIEVAAQLRSDGAASVEVTETFRGAGAIAWRRDLETIPGAVLEQRFEEAYVARLVPGASLSSLRITGREDPEEPLVFRYVFDVGAFGRPEGGVWVVPGIFPTRLSPVYAQAGERSLPQIVAPPIDLDVQIRVTWPTGATASRLPQQFALRGPNGASARMTVDADERAVTLRRRVLLPLMRVAPARYPQLAAFCRAVDEAEAQELAVTPGS